MSNQDLIERWSEVLSKDNTNKKPRVIESLALPVNPNWVDNFIRAGEQLSAKPNRQKHVKSD